MKRLIHIDKPKSKRAKEQVKKYGPVVQVADEWPDSLRIVSVKEEGVHDIRNLKHWSYWIDKVEIEWTELNEEFKDKTEQLSLIAQPLF